MSARHKHGNVATMHRPNGNPVAIAADKEDKVNAMRRNVREFKCRHDNVLIEVEHKAASDGGVLLPETYREPGFQTGTVLSVGPGAFNPHTGERVPMDLRFGDVVYILFRGNQQQINFGIQGEKEARLSYFCVPESAICGLKSRSEAVIT